MIKLSFIILKQSKAIQKEAQRFIKIELPLEKNKKTIELDKNNSTALYLLASLLNEQNSNDCIQYYEKCIQINNKFYLAYNGLGNFYLKSDQFDKAEFYYTKAIEINPKRSAKIYKNRAYLREKQKKNYEAKNDLKAYLELFPKAKDRGIIEQAIREL